MASLSQSEADSLLAMHKYYNDRERVSFPSMGEARNISLYSLDKEEAFSLDITCGRISLTKNSFQNRARKNIILARLDLGGSPHRNPDGKKIACPHLHLYR